MRVLFYLGEKQWSGTSRAVLDAARGLAAREHSVTIACCSDSRLDERARAANIETVAINSDATATGGAWDLRRIIKDKFIEVVVVTSERDQLVVSSARLFADRGAVLRRLPSFEALTLQTSGRFALRMAASGVIITTPDEMHALNTPGWVIPPAVAPIGIDPAAFDDVEAADLGRFAIPKDGALIACAYDASGRYRIASIFRTLALLGSRRAGLRVVVFGPGSRDESLRMHASALGVGSLLSFVGDGEDEHRIMRAATAGWVVSGGDNAAYACLDFMALRVPVIAERSPLTRHYIADGITGTLLPTTDVEPSYTASSVSAFLANREKLAAMGNAGRTRVQREFSDTAAIDAFERAVNAAGDRTNWKKK
jgi:glycosyltransferase involved in cell wall biosynthesis